MLACPEESTLVLGPRATGKSTWIQQQLPRAITYDLLKASDALRLARDPSQLEDELAGLPAGTWVVIDEVQKVPELLDEVHRLMEKRKLRFLLSGSSARKLVCGRQGFIASARRIARHALHGRVCGTASTRGRWD